MKKLLKILFIVLCFFLILFIGFYKYYEHKFNENLKTKKFNDYLNKIENSKNLPDNFYKIYEEINPKSLENDFLSSLINKTECQSQNVARTIYLFVKRQNANRTENLTFEYFLTRKIEENTTQRQCLNWITENFDFLYQVQGIENASEFYFKKKIDDLNEVEIKTLIKMLKNPVLYNPLRNKK